MARGNYVVDENNIPEAILAIKSGLSDGMAELHNDTLSTVLFNWDSGADALGNPWAPLAESTIQDGNGQPLIDSGDLRSDVEESSHYEEDEMASVITSSLDYAGVHEFGLPEQGVPARPFLSPAAKYASQNFEEFVSEPMDTRLEAARIRGGF